MSDIAKKESTPSFYSNWPFSSSIFDDLRFPSMKGSASMDTIPSVNVKENGNNFQIEFAAPGLSKNDFDVHVENGILTVECEKRKSEHETDDNFTRKEFQYTSFKRSFSLPENIKDEEVVAKYQDGILNISIPKKVSSSNSDRKKVTVN